MSKGAITSVDVTYEGQALTAASVAVEQMSGGRSLDAQQIAVTATNVDGTSLVSDAATITGTGEGGAVDAVSGGIDTDILKILGMTANNTLDALFNGTALNNFECGIITNVELFIAHLLSDGDTTVNNFDVIGNDAQNEIQFTGVNTAYDLFGH